jgi:4-hydroxyacetophenone monooxygenase
VLRRIMSHVAGAEIPEQYTDFLMDEMALEGASSRDPQWEAPHREAGSKLNVLVIGAGMSGLLAGIRLSQAGVPFTILDKNAEVGGTWLENTYPGCRVDSSNHMYSYSFEPHVWPQYFSTQPVLLDYFRGIAERHGLREHIRFNTTVHDAAWDDDRALWRVRVTTADGREETLEANTVITAVGQLNRPRYPDIPGRDSFGGEAFHSAEWRHDVDLTGKRVAVIGTGASAFQFVPEIAAKVAQLTVFQRTPPWAFPAPHYHHDIEAGKNWLLQHVPAYGKWWRFLLFWSATDGFLPGVTADDDWTGDPKAVGQANAEFRELLAQSLPPRRRIAPTSCRT